LIGSFKQQAFEERVEKDYRGEDKDGEEGNDEDLESSDDDSDKEELTNKAVDRLKKKTRAERNAKVSISLFIIMFLTCAFRIAGPHSQQTRRRGKSH